MSLATGCRWVAVATMRRGGDAAMPANRSGFIKPPVMLALLSVAGVY
jgi:hypothetical protein